MSYYFAISLVVLLGAVFFGLLLYVFLTKAKDESDLSMIESSVLALVIIAVISGILFMNRIQKEDAISVDMDRVVKGGLYGFSFNTKNIDHVTLSSFPVRKEKIRGFNIFGVVKGDFWVEDYGVARIYIRDIDNPFVYVRAEGQTYLINLNTKEETKALYEMLYYVYFVNL